MGNDDNADLGLSPEWQDWVIDNALDGATVQELVDAIVEEGVDADLVEREVLQLVTSAGFRAAQQWRRRALRHKKVNALRVAYHRGHGPDVIERRAGVPPDDIRALYMRAAQPVVLTDVVDRWPALTKWTDGFLKTTVGHVEVTACTGRNAADDPNHDIERFYTKMPFADFVDQVAGAGVTNDLYLVGNTRFLEADGADVLLDDVDDDVQAYLDGPVVKERCSFWFGPAGTVTALHHDPTSVLYAQVRGQKRFRLLSPGNVPALMAADGTYADIDVDDAARGMDDRVYDVTLSPGELLLLPAGWWHEVTALSPSISLGLTNLPGPTSFAWYHPGKVGNEVVARSPAAAVDDNNDDDNDNGTNDAT